VLENVLTPVMIRHSLWDFWKHRQAFRDQARELLGKVGLGHRLTHRPSELSGGEMQRAAIARALMGNPEVLLADEPTGNLDASTGGEIMELLTALNAQNELTIIMVTHDEAIAQRAHRVVRLAEGRLEAWGEAA
jgi:lipoprotein-releasing system ATP-binding protein